MQSDECCRNLTQVAHWAGTRRSVPRGLAFADRHDLCDRPTPSASAGRTMSSKADRSGSCGFSIYLRQHDHLWTTRAPRACAPWPPDAVRKCPAPGPERSVMNWLGYVTTSFWPPLNSSAKMSSSSNKVSIAVRNIFVSCSSSWPDEMVAKAIDSTSRPWSTKRYRTPSFEPSHHREKLGTIHLLIYGRPCITAFLW